MTKGGPAHPLRPHLGSRAAPGAGPEADSSPPDRAKLDGLLPRAAQKPSTAPSSAGDPGPALAQFCLPPAGMLSCPVVERGLGHGLRPPSSSFHTLDVCRAGTD